ncbi:hypothetical protein EVAR_87062_1 [Eumeta japonica]|uniref:Uncharacterized protein n=1 Tax=Eumeta variegata TaxID=151549 RepID=A0A4C1VQ60_EUMVA|nr:hypothetical protein EVAR_87062_1 [Eumeta japonica]
MRQATISAVVLYDYALISYPFCAIIRVGYRAAIELPGAAALAGRCELYLMDEGRVLAKSAVAVVDENVAFQSEDMDTDSNAIRKLWVNGLISFYLSKEKNHSLCATEAHYAVDSGRC